MYRDSYCSPNTYSSPPIIVRWSQPLLSFLVACSCISLSDKYFFVARCNKDDMEMTYNSFKTDVTFLKINNNKNQSVE